MTIQTPVFVSTQPDDGKGDKLRDAFIKINERFQEVESSQAAGISEIYQGARPSDPTVRGDDSPLKDGDFYFNTTLATPAFKVYVDGAWVIAPDIMASSLAAVTGSTLVGFQQDGTGAVPRTVDGKLRESVSVKDFGAVGDGVTDDTAAIRAAATAANASGATLLVNPGTYFINSGSTAIPIKVSVLAHGAVFKLGAGKTNEVFEIMGDNALLDITENVTLSDFARGNTLIPSLTPYQHGFIKIVSNIPNVKRTPSSAAMLTKAEAGYITKGGSLIQPIRHDYSTGGTITNVYYRKDEGTPLVFAGGGIDVNGQNYAIFVRISRNDVVVRGWKVLDSSQASRIDQALLIRAFDVANTTLEGISGEAMNQSDPAPVYSYVFDGAFIVNTRFDKCFLQAGWGSIKADHAFGYHISNSVFDRFDVHYEGWDISADKCEFYHSGIQFGCGGGYIRLTNCTKIVKPMSTFSKNETFRREIVAQRGDYAGYFYGDILVDNVKVVVCDNYTGPLFGVRFRSQGDYGQSEPLPLGYTINVSNIQIEASDASMADFNTRFFGVSFDGALLYNGSTPGALLPHRVSVSQISYNKPNTFAALVAVKEQDPAYVATGSDECVFSIIGGVGGNARGQMSTDFQQQRDFAFKVALGKFSGILAGESNYAEGQGSGIVAGSNNKAGTQSTSNSFIGAGVNNLANGSSAGVLCGSDNQALGIDSFVGAGQRNIARAAYSFIIGGRYADTRARLNSWAHSGNTGVEGRAQCAGMSLSLQTTDATPSVITTSGVASSASQFSIPFNVSATFDVLVTARRTNGWSKAWRLSGLIKSIGGVTSIVGAANKTVIAADSNTGSWDVSATADSTHEALVITVTGESGVNIRWHAKVDASEVTN